MDQIQKEVLEEVEKLGFGLAKVIPQVKDSKGIYYISGSLAMLMLSKTKTITPCKLSPTGEFVEVGEKENITSGQKEALSKGVRKMGADLDVVTITDDDIPYTAKTQKDLGVDNKKLSNSIFSSLGIDPLAETHTVGSHNVAVVENEQGQCALITCPVDLLLHKASELIMLLGRLSDQNLKPTIREICKKKATKDVLDFSSMFNAVVQMKMYPKDIVEYIKAIQEHGSQFSTQNTSQSVFNSGCESFINAVAPYIDAEHIERLNEFAGALPNLQEHNNISTFSL